MSAPPPAHDQPAEEDWGEPTASEPSKEKAAPTVRLDPETIEALAERVAVLVAGEKAKGEDGEASARQGISAQEVARAFRVSRRWVYENAEALGALRIGRGARPRLRFDPAKVAVVLGAPDARGCAAIDGDRGADSLSSGTRASVADVARRPAGRAKARRLRGAARAAEGEKDAPPRRA